MKYICAISTNLLTSHYYKLEYIILWSLDWYDSKCVLPSYTSSTQSYPQSCISKRTYFWILIRKSLFKNIQSSCCYRITGNIDGVLIWRFALKSGEMNILAIFNLAVMRRAQRSLNYVIIYYAREHEHMSVNIIIGEF